MIKKLTILFALLLPICINSQMIIEKFRSEGNARNPLKRLIRNTDDSQGAITDFNGNGSDDIVSFKGTDEELQIVGYDGSSYDEIFNITAPSVFQTFPGDEVSRIPLLYPMGAGLDYLIITMTNVQEGDRTLIIDPKDETDFLFVPGRTYLIADMDGDNWIDVLSWDLNDQSLVVHGIDNGSGVRNEVPSNTIRGKSEINLIYESDPDLRFNIDAIVPRSSLNQDINGDGAVDVTVLRRDNNDRLNGIRVVDVLSREILFQKSLDELNEEVVAIHGYYDIDGDEIKEVLIGDDLLIDMNGDISAIADNFQIQGVLDVNGDGVDDIVGVNVEKSSVQVWGLNNSTSVEDIERKLGIVKNYPNPFLHNTTIEYQLEDSGIVRIDLRNTQGSLVSSLKIGKRPAGTHQEEFNLTALPGGTYYYSIVVDGRATTQKLIKL